MGEDSFVQFQIFKDARKGARATNQDRIGYVYTNECLMMIVCDGMGGHAKGEVASQIAVESLSKSFRQSADPKIKDPATFLAKTILFAHEAILNFARVQEMPETPRTTCVAAIVQDGKVWWGNVGDSRLYMIRSGAVHKRTVDHSHVQSLQDAGLITAAQAMVHRDRNKIFNCLGQPMNPRIDVTPPVVLEPQDKIVLCSDGFWGPLRPETIARSLDYGHLGVNIPILMDLAETVSGRECDNLSVVAMNWFSSSGIVKDAARLPPLSDDAIIDDAALSLSRETIRMACRARPSFRQWEA